MEEKRECSECGKAFGLPYMLLCPSCGAALCMNCATTGGMLCPYCNGALPL